VLKYIFAIIFVLLAWALALVFQPTVPIWTAVVATVVIVGGLVAFVVIRMLAGQRAAAQIEKGLRDQAMQHAGGVRPDLRGEIAAMEGEFQRAVQALKKSKLGRNARDVLGLLPWYVIIGPSASGKTTAIRSSGIKMPLGKSAKVRGVGGTRNCDWWMTNEAILLDTAGRWSTEDDDRDEWLAFLDLLKRTRPKKPINGVLLAVSATDLQGTEEEIAELGATLRERIDELCGRLEMVVPVYLMVTKCDLISGFVETFGDLKDRERGQIWGFTLPVVGDHEAHVDAFAEQFDELAEVLERHTLVRLGEERRIEARDAIYAFPRQFDSLRQGLVDLTAALFDQNVYQDGPIMRGVYFTSGTQEGSPVDRVMASMAEAFGVRPPVIAAPTTKPKSYFVRDLFQEVVFSDQDIAIRSGSVLKRERLIRWGTALAALAVSVAFVVVPISSYLDNRQFVADSRAFVDKLARAREDHAGNSPLAVAPLEGADAMAGRLATFASKGPDVSMRFGLYPGDRLLDPVRIAVERLVILPIMNADASRLLDFAGGRGDADASGATNGLMLHLLLTQPKAADEPSPENDGWHDRWVDVAADKASERWLAVTGDSATTRARHTIENAVKFYAARANASGDLVERNPRVVSRVRAALLQANQGDPLAELLRDPNLPRDVRLIDVAGGAVTVFQSTASAKTAGPSVPGAFTPAGWKVIKDRIERLTADREKERDETSWLLGASSKAAAGAADAAAMRAGYFRRYVDAWRSFLLSLSVQAPTSVDEARSLVKALLTQKPLDAVWRNAAKNLVFKDDAPLAGAINKAKGGLMQKVGAAKRKLLGGDGKDGEGEGDAAPGGGGKEGREGSSGGDPMSPEDVGAEFSGFLGFGLNKPTGLDAYTAVLTDLSAALGEQGSPDPKAFQTAIKNGRLKLSTLISNYNEHGWEAGLLDRILMPPLSGAEVAVSGATGESANRKWCESVVVVFDQLLAGRYPFSTNRKVREARVADVDKFFQPKTGILWQYYAEALQADFDHPAGTTVFTLKDQASVKYKPNLIVFLKRAQELTDLLYAKEPGKINVAVSMRLRASAPYTKITFESSGRKLTYFNTKERWEDVPWPGQGALFRLFLKAGDSEYGQPEGEWALFHLLDQGKLTSASEGEEYLAGTWTPPDQPGAIHADIKPANLPRAFRGIEIPRGIIGGATGCR
jgi:type VI secretion system protein ImpL